MEKALQVGNMLDGWPWPPVMKRIEDRVAEKVRLKIYEGLRTGAPQHYINQGVEVKRWLGDVLL